MTDGSICVICNWRYSRIVQGQWNLSGFVEESGRPGNRGRLRWWLLADCQICMIGDGKWSGNLKNREIGNGKVAQSRIMTCCSNWFRRYDYCASVSNV